MYAYRPLTRVGLLLVAVGGWTIAALLSWLLINRIGWFGVVLLGLAILFVCYRVAMDEDNAIPDYASGKNPVYKAQYQREFGNAKPEERLAARANRSVLERFLYIARTIGVALLFFGLGMFLMH